MTSDIRVQYQFQSVSDALANGWTENFYFSATSAQQALDVVGALPNLTLRLNCLGADFRLSQVRCIAVGNRSDVAVRTLDATQGLGKFLTAPGETFNSEQPWDALLWKIVGATGKLRNWSMRGVPTGIFKDTMAIGTAQPGYLQNLTLLANYIGGTGHPSQFEMRVLTYPDTQAVSLPSFINSNRQLQVQFTGPSVPAWIARGKIVRLQNIFGISPDPNHLWRIQDVAPGATVTVTMFKGRRSYFGTASGPGIINSVVPTFIALNGMTPVRATKRNTGRPPALLRGRGSRRQS